MLANLQQAEHTERPCLQQPHRVAVIRVADLPYGDALVEVIFERRCKHLCVEVGLSRAGAASQTVTVPDCYGP